MIALDSSAMIAYLDGEPGGGLVASLLQDDEHEIALFAHALNLCEVYYHYALLHGIDRAEQAIENLKDDGIVERNDMDAAFWRDVAFLIHTQRSAGHKLALGDACGLALARRVGGEFYTTDRAELQHVPDELCPVSFLR